MTIAMQYAPASHGAVVLAVLPLLTAMAGALVAGERPSLGFWACGVAGTGAVFVYALLSGAGSGDLHWADLLLAGCGVVGGHGLCAGRRDGAPHRRLGGDLLGAGVLLAGDAGCCAGVAGPINWARRRPRGPASSTWPCSAMFLGFFAWNKGLAMGGIARISQMQLLQPFVALWPPAALLGEPIGWLEIALRGAGGRAGGAGLAHAGCADALSSAARTPQSDAKLTQTS